MKEKVPKKSNIKKSKKTKSSMNNGEKQKKRWYEKTGWIIFWLLLFFPVGAVLMWRNPKWNKVLKVLLSGFLGFWFLIVCIAVATPTEPPDKIILSADSGQIYDINSKVDIELKTNPSDCYIPQSAFHVSGGELDLRNDKIVFTSSEEGEFDIYVKYSDIISNKLTLKFEDKEAIAQAEQERIAAEQARIEEELAEQERIAAEQAEQERIAAEQAEQARIAAEQAEQERIAAEQAEQARIAAEQAEQARIAAEQTRIAQEQNQQANVPAGGMVWLSATGEKYHNKPNCGRMNPDKARQVPLAEAQQHYEACKNCYR